MTRKQIGGYGFNSECASIRQSLETMRMALTRIIDENPGPQKTNVLIARAAMEIPKISNAVNNIEEIGKKAKTPN